MNKKLLEMMAPRLKANNLLMSIEDYLKRFKSVLGRDRGGHTLRPYFDSMSKVRSGDVEVGMLRFCKSATTEWVPGGPWPGHYAMYHITDYRLAKEVKGRKKVEIKGGYDYVDWPGMNDEIPYPLKTTEQNIAGEVERKRTSLYNVPHRFYERYKGKLLIMIGDTRCQGNDLTPEMLAEVLAEMTPFEKSIYQQSLYKIDVSLYPSIEQPVRIRITGIDDGAEEALFPSVEEAQEAMKEIALFNLRDTRRQKGFQSTD